MSELYCGRLSKESAVRRDVREGVKGNVGAEVGGVRDTRWNRVSPDTWSNHSSLLSWSIFPYHQLELLGNHGNHL